MSSINDNSIQREKKEKIKTETLSCKKIIYKAVVYGGNHPEAMKEALLRRGNFEVSSGNELTMLPTLHLLWRSTTYGLKGWEQFYHLANSRRLDNPLLFNHIRGISSITSKTGILRSLFAYYSTLPAAREARYDLFDTIPTSFELTANLETEEYKAFAKRFRELASRNYHNESMPIKYCRKNLWLLKPANLNQGRGIEVHRSLKEIRRSLNKKPKDSIWVLQKYIERPLLYEGRKFDIFQKIS